MKWAAFILGLCSSVYAQRYTVLELPPLPQLEAQWDRGVQAVNNAGNVLAVGISTGDTKFRSFLFTGSQWQEIVVSNFTLATSLNNLGQVTGRAFDDESNGPVYPFLWTTNGFTTLPLPNYFATAINDRGFIAGFVSGGGAFLWSDGVVRNLNTTSAEYWPQLNNRNQLALTTGMDGRVRAFFVSGKQIRFIAPDKTHVWAYSMNNRGDVVGGFQNGSVAHAYLNSHGRLMDLQRDLDEIGVAYLINDLREIIGWARHADGSDGTFLIRDGKRHELRDLIDADGSWEFGIPSAASANGLFAGMGVHDNRTVAYILVPDHKPGRKD
jgi:hypothetical protein